MARYYIDFETRSEHSIKDVSVFQYLHSKFAGIVCMAWNKDQTTTNLWLPRMPPPFVIQHDDEVFGFNIGTFDRRVWNILGERHGFCYMHLDVCRDVMALCGRFGLPQNLGMAGRALDVNTHKNPLGKKLMAKICQPPFEYTPQELRAFYAYCLDDVNTMIDVVNALPAPTLEPSEQKIWQVTMERNDKGLPIDLRAVRRIKQVVDFYKQREVKHLPVLTDGAVKTPGQIAAIRNWCESKGVLLLNLQAATVEEALEDKTLPWQVKRVLELRQELGRSSLAKYDKLLKQSYGAVMYDNERYYRALTGRFGGMGFQAHNLPRASVPDPEETIDKFYSGEILNEDVMYAGKALIRPMIRAPKGSVFVMADFSSIEYILLMWLAHEGEHLRRFADGFDPYIDEATRLYRKTYDEVTKLERQNSKPVVLGAGYCLGPGGLIGYAKQYKVQMSAGEAEFAINTYRASRQRVVRLWYALRDCAISAIHNSGREFGTNKCTFQVFTCQAGRTWMRLRLPSGRALFYLDPQLQDDRYGPAITFMGLEATTNQWIRQRMIPSRIIENVIQALARDVLVHCVNLIRDAGYDTRLTVHDETLSLIDDSDVGVHDVNIGKLMSTPPDWCPDLPLRAEPSVTKRFMKG